MEKNRRWLGILKTALSLALLGLLFFTLAPAQVGGRTAYVVVSGNSMEPGLYRGDLVILRATGDYQVGDVVAYRHPDIGQVIHRIVAREGERFFLQGDHNSWIDSHQPLEPDVIGELWIHLPRAGGALWGFRTPLGAGILAGVLGVFLLWPDDDGGAGQEQDQAEAKAHSRDRRPRALGNRLADLDLQLTVLAQEWLGRTTLSHQQLQRVRHRMWEIGAELDGLPLLLFDNGALIGRTVAIPPETAAVIGRGTRRLCWNGLDRPDRVWVHLDIRSAVEGGARDTIPLLCVRLTQEVRLVAVWDERVLPSTLREAVEGAAGALQGLL